MSEEYCGSKEFQVFGEGLSIIEVTENTVTLQLNPHQCKKAGKFNGFILIRLKDHPQVAEKIHFEYLLKCETMLNLIHYDAGPFEITQ